MDKEIIIIKGEETTDKTLKKVINFVKGVDGNSVINISSELVCLDIPPKGAQVIWANGTESILAPEEGASDE